eukprot:IDg4351t1
MRNVMDYDSHANNLRSIIFQLTQFYSRLAELEKRILQRMVAQKAIPLEFFAPCNEPTADERTNLCIAARSRIASRKRPSRALHRVWRDIASSTSVQITCARCSASISTLVSVPRACAAESASSAEACCL